MANNFIGTGLDQVSVNGMLGSLAFQDATAPSFGRVAVGQTSVSNFIRFPNTSIVVSNMANTVLASIGNETHSIGLVGEGIGDANNSGTWGIGVYGIAYTANTARCGAVTGEAHVSNTTDASSAIGVRAYAFDTHSGGMNIGLYGEATNSSVGNYALYMNNGNIYSNVQQTWTIPTGLILSTNIFANTSVSAVNATTTLTNAQMIGRVITCNSATAVTLTLVAGATLDSGIGSSSPANTSFEWSVVNTGSSVGAITMAAGTSHTYIGNTTINIGTSARFNTTKTATSTFATYRIA
jgi:hypothetical protein